MTSGTPGICRSQRLLIASPSFRVLGDVDGPDVGTHRAPEVHRLDHRPIDPVDRDDDALLAMGALDDQVLADMELALLTVVFAPDEQHHADEHRDQDDHEPRPVDELHARDDDRDDRRRRTADGVDDEAVAPAAVTGRAASAGSCLPG